MKFEELVEKVKEFEGFCKVAYYCPAGVLTIGYGRTENARAAPAARRGRPGGGADAVRQPSARGGGSHRRRGDRRGMRQ